MSGSKLVENLAESLVNELSESKTLDLMNDQKFSEFTDLLWEILDRVDKAEDREKEKEKENKEPEESAKELTDKINKYFEQLTGDKSPGDLSSKTDRILSIVKKLLLKQDSGEEDDKKKKEQKKTDASSEQGKNEVDEANKKKEEEKKEEQKAELDKQTVLMLKKLTKGFEESEKRRKKENSVIRKGLRRVERKIGSFIWKALNKFKGLLLIGALIFFRKPIIDFFKKIWTDYLKPHVEPLIVKLGEMIGGLWNDLVGWFEGTFPELNDWIQKDWPKIQDWFKKNWDNVKEWFTDTIPTLMDGINQFLGDTWLGRKLDKKIKDTRRSSAIRRANKISPDGDWEAQKKKDELLLEAAEISLDFNKKEKERLEGKVWKDYSFTPVGLVSFLRDRNQLKRINAGLSDQEESITLTRQAIKDDEKMAAMFGNVAPDMSDYQRMYVTKDRPKSKAEMEYPEDDNPEGGLGSQSSINDALAQEGKTMFDFGKQIINYTPFNQVTKNYFQATPPKLHK
jgi:hypothetical protein